MADRVMVMYAGEVMESGPAEEIVRDPRHPYTKLLLYSSPDPWKEKGVEPIAIIEPQGPPPIGEGCSFRHRCPFAADACAREDIKMKAVDERREIRCIL